MLSAGGVPPFALQEAAVQPVRVKSGWVTFAAVVAMIVGVYNVLSGIAAIAKDDRTEALGKILYGIDVSAWGWFWLIIGILQVLTAYLIYDRRAIGQVLGLVWAFISACLTVFVIWVAPLWALAILALQMLVIYALTAYSEEFSS
jgi:hypothetical protein